MNDKELLEKAIYFGKNALHWRQLFIGLLPEINKRKLYELKGCSSILEFAAKFGGVSKEQLKLTIKLEERFTEMPRLHEALVTGGVSINKLARVVSIATKENETELLNMVSNLQKAIRSYPPHSNIRHLPFTQPKLSRSALQRTPRNCTCH